MILKDFLDLLVEFLKFPWLSLVSFGTFCSLWFLWNPFGSFENQTFLNKDCFCLILELSKNTQSIAELCRRHLKARIRSWKLFRLKISCCVSWSSYAHTMEHGSWLFFHDSLSDLALNATINGYLSVCLFDSTIYYFFHGNNVDDPCLRSVRITGPWPFYNMTNAFLRTPL